MNHPGDGLRRLMPPQFREAIRIMVAAMAELPETDQDITESADRLCDHIAAEVVTIRHVSRLRERERK